MLSVPRDLFVNIPGFGYSRINTAYPSGEASRLPGGGPGLVMKTVSQFTGIPLQYYIYLDFDTFVSMINTLGGIDVYVDQKLILDPQGTGRDHVVITCCGVRHIDGQIALAYARTRDASQGATLDDVGRAHRQQKIIFAIRDKVFSPSYFPTFIAQAPKLYREFAAGIHSNLTFEDAVKLAYLVKDIPPEHIQTGVIDYSMSAPARVTLAGVPADVMIPFPDKIRVLIDQIFMTGSLVSPIAEGDPLTLMKQDNASVRVWNGTSTTQLDARTANYLLAKQVHVTDIGDAPLLYRQTTILVYSPKIYTLRYLVQLFNVTSGNQIDVRPDPSNKVDIEVRLGSDWLGNLPTGY
jgi:LCP family protein required for cell wall assembly